DVDFFKLEFQDERPMVLNANVTAVENLDLRLEILDKNLVTIMTVNNSGIGQSETIPNLLLRSSPIYIRVSAGSNFNNEQQYVLSTHLTLPEKNTEYEPDNIIP